MLEGDMDNYLGYEKYGRSDEVNYRNGRENKKVRSKYGEVGIYIPQDRNSTFQPQAVAKRQKDIEHRRQNNIDICKRHW